MDGDERMVDGSHAVVDALLRERLGREVAPDLTAKVLARAAAGDGADAARRLAFAEGRVGAGRVEGGRGGAGRWLAAALALLGVGVVFAVATTRPDGGDGAAVAGPQEPGPQAPAEPEIVPVRTIEQLRELLPQTVGLTIELRSLTLRDLELKTPMRPLRVDRATAEVVAAAIACGLRAEPEPANRTQWDFRLLLVRADGKALELLLANDDGLERERRVRGAVRGLLASVSVGKLDACVGEREERLIETAFAEAMQALAVANGVVSSLQPDRLEPFRACESVTLVPHLLFPSWGGIRTRDLKHLVQLPKLRRLDVSRIPDQIDLWAIDHIAQVAGLEQLVLDGCAVDDQDLEPLERLPKLRALSLRACPRVAGGFLGRATVGHERVAVPFAALERLDLSGRALTSEVLRAIAGLDTLRDLALERCELDDDDLRVLAGGKSPLTALQLRGNPALTLQGLQALRAVTTLATIDARDCGLDGDAGGDVIEPRAGQRVRLR